MSEAKVLTAKPCLGQGGKSALGETGQSKQVGEEEEEEVEGEGEGGLAGPCTR